MSAYVLSGVLLMFESIYQYLLIFLNINALYTYQKLLS